MSFYEHLLGQVQGGSLLQELLGNAPLPARHLLFPRSFILVIIIKVVKAQLGFCEFSLLLTTMEAKPKVPFMQLTFLYPSTSNCLCSISLKGGY